MRRSLDCTAGGLALLAEKAKLRARTMKRGFPPIADASTKIFLLGSLPGDKSIENQQYYAHHTNQFWKILGYLLGEQLDGVGYDDRLAILKAHGIGLWDVFSAAQRSGSGDASIRNASHNPIEAIHAQFPLLEAIGFNGGRAALEGRRLLEANGLMLYDLPSSSGMCRTLLPQKIEQWTPLVKHFA